MKKKRKSHISESNSVDRYRQSLASPSTGDGSQKLPVSSLSSKKPLASTEYFLVKPSDLEEFRLKDNRDFSPWDEESFEELVLSIGQYGILNPIVIRPIDEDAGTYEILSGEHRWKAAKTLRLSEVPCRVFRGTDEEAKAVFALTNLLSRQLTLVDKIIWGSEYYTITKGKDQKLIESLKKQELLHVLEAEDLSKRQLYKYYKLSTLPSDLLQAVGEGRITERAGEQMANFSLEELEILEEFAPNIKNSKVANFLISIQKGEVEGYRLDLEGVQFALGESVKGPAPGSFTNAVACARKVIKQHLPKESYCDTTQILTEALELHTKYREDLDILDKALGEYKKNHS